MNVDYRAEHLLRELAPQVLGALVHRYGVFDAYEDAVQEALLAAALQWPAEGLPDNPRGWLVTVASRRLVDQVRSEHARRRREDVIAFESAVTRLPEAVACHHITGNFDYLLQVEVADLPAYEDFHADQLASLPGVATVTSYVTMKTLSADTT
ncbi:Lrp/AsnC ligand binding domain-containing protein [Streptomyces sp. NPDC002596]